MTGVQYDGIRRVSVVECPKPEIQGNEALIRVACAGICGTDLHAYAAEGESVGIIPGNVFGHEMVGVIEEAGAGAFGIDPGTPAFCQPHHVPPAPGRLEPDHERGYGRGVQPVCKGGVAPLWREPVPSPGGPSL